MNLPGSQFQSIQESDAFLHLFPHRFDFIYAEHPDPGDRPDWKTESRHPLSDRQIQQGVDLYGVRFGKLTLYLMLDIDRHSAHHPCQDPFAIRRMLAALEVIGLVAYVAVTSSDSGGLHLYFPFEQAQQSWAIALVVSTLLENTGFKLKPGQLEVFPNPRPYTNGTPSLYNGHRLPLQAGSYLLNQYWEQVYSDQAAFVEQWRWAEQRNDLNQETVKRVLKQAKRQRYKGVTGSADKFLNDLNTEIEPGWTGTSQTNDLLGWIAMREYIFGHILRGGAPITGPALAAKIREVAVELPGYKEWCRHQHEIDKKAAEWARSIEADPNYYPYDPSKRRKSAPQLESQPTNNIVSFNQQLALDAAARIQAAIASLKAADIFPSGATARADAILALARCSNQTVHKYKALWHPDYIERSVGTVTEPVTAPSGNPDAVLPKTLEPLPERSLHPFCPNKFRAHPAAPSGQAERQREVGGCGGQSTGIAIASDNRKSERVEKHLAQMQRWLVSGDRILVAEAQQFFTAQAQQESVSLVSTDVVAPEQPEGCSREEAVMPGGFGRSQPQRRSSKTALQASRQLSVVPQPPVQAPDVDLAIQVEVEAFFTQYQQEHPEETALAWSAGVYNPLAQVDLLAVGARYLEPEEEDWLALARMVGWLLVEDELDAIYFTAPPPAFALEQADWYVRPDLTTFLESPTLLREAVQQYPMTEASLRGAIDQRVQQLGWTWKQRTRFMLEVCEQPEAALTQADWKLLLFELQSRLQDLANASGAAWVKP